MDANAVVGDVLLALLAGGIIGFCLGWFMRHGVSLERRARW